MKYSYFFGAILAIIFPGLIQFYNGEKNKGANYIVFYFLTFLAVFVIYSVSNQSLEIDYEQILSNDFFTSSSLFINVFFRVISGLDGLNVIRKYHKRNRTT